MPAPHLPDSPESLPSRDDTALQVLLVEDNPGDARLFEEYLGESPTEATLRHEETLQAGLQAIGEERPDVLALDLGLPDSEGPGTVKDADEAAPGVPIVVLTGQDDLQVALQAQEAGATEYLQKDNLAPALVGRTLRWALKQRRMQAELRRRDAWVRSITEGLSAGVFRAGPTGQIEYANEALAEMLGFETEEELIGQDLTTFYADPTDQGRMLAEEGATEAEIEFDAQDGSTVVGLLSAKAGHNADGIPVYYDGTVTDITERKKREERLRMLSEAVEQAKDTVLITEAAPLDEPGPRIVYANEAFEEMTGYSTEEVLGKTPRILQGPETERGVLDSMRAALDAGEEWEGESINYRKDGEPYRVRWNLSPVRNEDGSIEHWLSIQRDVTEQREREETLRRQKSLLEQTQRLAGAWKVDLEAGELSWSERVYQIHEVEPGTEVSVEKSIDFYPPEARSRIREAFRNCVEEREPYDLELPIVTAEGNRRWVRTVGAPAERKNGEVVEVAGAFQNITERKEAQEDLRRSRERYRSLFEDSHDAILVHDLEGRIREVNPQAESLFGRGAGELKGRSIQALHAPGEEETAQEKLRALRAGETYQAVSRYERAGGATFWGEVFASAIDVGGETVVRSLIRDVTERKRRRRERKNRLEALSTTIPGAAFEFRVGPDGERSVEFMGAEAKSLLGVSGESEALWEKLVKQIPEPHREGILQSVEEAIDAQSRWQREIPFERPDGERIWLLGSSKPTVEGEEIVFRGTLLEITEQKERERRLNAVFNQTYQFTGLMEPDGTLVEANDTALRFGGLDEEDVLGRPIWDTFWFEGKESRQERLKTAVARAREGEFVRYEMEVRGAEEDRIVDFSLRPIIDELGDVTMIVPEGRDITDRKEGEQALRQRQDKIEALYETANRLLRASNEEEVAEVLARLVREVLGYRGVWVHLADSGTLTTSPGAESSPELRPLPPNFSVEGESVVAEAYRSGETLVAEDLEAAEIDDPIAEGDVRSAVIVPMEGQGVLSVASPAPDAIGAFDKHMVEVLGAYGTAVLDRLDQEEALREERDLLDRLLATSPAAILMTDEEGQFAYANKQAEAVLGIGKDDVTERAFNDPEWSITAVDGSPLPERELPFARVISTGEPVRDVRHAIEWPDGTRRILSVSGAPLRDADGHIEGALFHVADVTKQKRRMEALREAKEEAEEAQRMQSAFLANMSHEIRTPLTSIIGFAEAIGTEVAELELPAGSPVGTHAGLIEESGKRLLDTLDSVLTLSKLEAEQMGFNAEPVDLRAEARWAAEELGAEAEEKDLDLHLETDDVRAQADEGGVQIVLRNLLSNAIKYTEEGGTVWLRTYREEGSAVLEVEDTGIGMDPETAERLFEAFRQASEGYGREYEGTGVGLAVTKKAVEQMGGRIEVETEEGEGSRFAVRLPRPETSGET